MVTEPTDRYLRADQVAAVLQIVPRSVYRLIKGRQLRAYKISRLLRIKESDLKEFIRYRSTQ